MLGVFLTGPTENRSAVATGVTGALLSILGLAAGALLFYFWFSRKAGGYFPGMLAFESMPF